MKYELYLTKLKDQCTFKDDCQFIVVKYKKCGKLLNITRFDLN